MRPAAARVRQAGLGTRDAFPDTDTGGVCLAGGASRSRIPPLLVQRPNSGLDTSGSGTQKFFDEALRTSWGRTAAFAPSLHRSGRYSGKPGSVSGRRDGLAACSRRYRSGPCSWTGRPSGSWRSRSCRRTRAVRRTYGSRRACGARRRRGLPRTHGDGAVASSWSALRRRLSLFGMSSNWLFPAAPAGSVSRPRGDWCSTAD
jgi:hypothetical protein